MKYCIMKHKYSPGCYCEDCIQYELKLRSMMSAESKKTVSEQRRRDNPVFVSDFEYLLGK